MRHPWFARADTPRVLAHRGLVTPASAAHGVAENSFAAFAEAHGHGVDYIESDAHITADGVVVLFHDDDLSRVTGDPRPLAAVPLRELEDLMAPLGGLVTLAQALEAFPDTRFNIDIKADAAAEPAGRIVAAASERVLVTSFSDSRRRRALAAARAAGGPGPGPATSAGTATIARLLAALATRSRGLAARAIRGVDALQIPERRGRVRILTPRLIEAAHRSGVEVHVWTVNDPADMRRLAGLGVDGVVTDRADVALRVLHPA
ncbi:glycerophosphodiester phosphodiesterase family protein [Microbacterium sp. NPDC078428]|uniref:glycerophosphodiester phosphodiesterase family protein n=1 Tax=Microbacterium sp. NPDC078428 TaxID=3364190 RepID=UPI0037C9EB0C